MSTTSISQSLQALQDQLSSCVIPTQVATSADQAAILRAVEITNSARAQLHALRGAVLKSTKKDEMSSLRKTETLLNRVQANMHPLALKLKTADAIGNAELTIKALKTHKTVNSLGFKMSYIILAKQVDDLRLVPNPSTQERQKIAALLEALDTYTAQIFSLSQELPNPEEVSLYFDLFQALEQRDTPRVTELMEQLHAVSSKGFTKDLRSTFLTQIHVCSGKPKTSDPKWGRNHATDNLENTAKALQAALKEALGEADSRVFLVNTTFATSLLTSLATVTFHQPVSTPLPTLSATHTVLPLPSSRDKSAAFFYSEDIFNTTFQSYDTPPASLSQPQASSAKPTSDSKAPSAKPASEPKVASTSAPQAATRPVVGSDSWRPRLTTLLGPIATYPQNVQQLATDLFMLDRKLSVLLSRQVALIQGSYSTYEIDMVYQGLFSVYNEIGEKLASIEETIPQLEGKNRQNLLAVREQLKAHLDAIKGCFIGTLVTSTEATGGNNQDLISKLRGNPFAHYIIDARLRLCRDNLDYLPRHFVEVLKIKDDGLQKHLAQLGNDQIRYLETEQKRLSRLTVASTAGHELYAEMYQLIHHTQLLLSRQGALTNPALSTYELDMAMYHCMNNVSGAFYSILAEITKNPPKFQDAAQRLEFDRLVKEFKALQSAVDGLTYGTIERSIQATFQNDRALVTAAKETRDSVLARNVVAARLELCQGNAEYTPSWVTPGAKPFQAMSQGQLQWIRAQQQSF